MYICLTRILINNYKGGVKMGLGKLNIWVRDVNCNVIKKAGHLHITDCHKNDVIRPFWFKEGHTEIEVPPGCYIVTAGMIGGNIYTDKTMVIVNCGDDACINLVMTDFSASNPPALVQQPLQYYCPLLFVGPLVQHALSRNLSKDDLHKAIDVIAQAANMDKEQMRDIMKKEAEMLRTNLKQFPDEEQKDVVKYVEALMTL